MHTLIFLPEASRTPLGTLPESLRSVTFLVLLAVLLAGLLEAAAAPGRAVKSGDCLVFVGTYTGEKSKGIYSFRMDPETGQLTPLALAAETPNPTFLAIHPSRRFLFAANEIGEFNGQKNCGAVSAFAIVPLNGKLKPLNQQPSGGGGPCHLAVDHAGRNVLVANYGGGSIACLPLKADGSLLPATAVIQHQGRSLNPRRQEGPHAHYISPDPADRFVLACDLGLDQVLVYQYAAPKGLLKPHSPPFATLKAGAGPRHLDFHPNGRFVYVLNELQSTVAVFRFDATRGTLQEIQASATLPVDFSGPNTTAEIEVHPSGEFLYASNRGHDSLAVFKIDTDTGGLTFVEFAPTQGESPRNFAIDPTGHFLIAANQASDNLVVFRIDPARGKLTPTGQTLSVGAPVCIQYLPLK